MVSCTKVSSTVMGSGLVPCLGNRVTGSSVWDSGLRVFRVQGFRLWGLGTLGF